MSIVLRLARAVPKYGRLVYCLYRDPRTPRWWKAGLGISLAAVWLPFIPLDWIPVVGEMEWLAVTLLAVRVAVARAPRELVEAHEAAIAAGTSYYHQDLARGIEQAGQVRHRIAG